MSTRAQAISVLTANTVAFMVCFAVWMMYGVLVTSLVDQQVFAFGKAQMGWLIGIPVLTGSLLRLPAGLLTDRFGGRPVITAIMLLAAVAAYLVSFANGFWDFLLGGLGFGIAGASFAAGIAYTSVWFPPHRQGTALGIFGVGNTGAALTAIVSPQLLRALTHGGLEPDRWRMLPRLYALALVVTAALFWLATFPRQADQAATRTLRQRLEPLGSARVWRFGLYYFLVFGGFVALAQWLIPYYVNVYMVSVVAAGLLSAAFSLPSGLFRAVGGWLSDRFGARAVMYWVLGGATVATLLLAVPRMEVQSPGEGVMAARAGTVTAVTATAVEVEGVRYALRPREGRRATTDEARPEQRGAEPQLVWPVIASWHEPVVRPGDTVPKGGLLARGVTRVYFQANMRVFTGIVLVLAILMGVGMAAVYKHIPTYFPNDVGTVGGLVGVIGGLGGFVDPILFGYLLQRTGIWTTTWVFLFALSMVCLAWMHLVVRRMMIARAPEVATHIEERGTPIPVSLRVLCPVHAVEAEVRVLAVAGTHARATLGWCSLYAGRGANLPCEGRCIVQTGEASSPGWAPGRGDR